MSPQASTIESTVMTFSSLMNWYAQHIAVCWEDAGCGGVSRFACLTVFSACTYLSLLHMHMRSRGKAMSSVCLSVGKNY